jgi:hypothetical protein
MYASNVDQWPRALRSAVSPLCHVPGCHVRNDGEQRTASTLTYVSACPASLISQEIPSRRIRIRITGSETTSQVFAALTMTGKHFLSVPSTFKDTIQLNPTLAVFQEANPLVSALKTSKSWRMKSECHLFQRPRLPQFRGRAERSNSYWVCEKSDGIRVLLVILTNLETSDQFVCIVRP